MFEVQISNKRDPHAVPQTIFESVHLKEAQTFYHDARRQFQKDHPNVDIRLIEVLRRS